jgi:hypothetical protein
MEATQSNVGRFAELSEDCFRDTVSHDGAVRLELVFLEVHCDLDAYAGVPSEAEWRDQSSSEEAAI